MKIVRTLLFDRSLRRLGASAADLERLEAEIAAKPAVGDVIQGLSGARKARFSMAGRGKSGGGRAIYVLVAMRTRPAPGLQQERPGGFVPPNSARFLQRSSGS
jgi:hypothetical protein